MDAISYTAARAKLATTMEQVCNDHAPVIITRKTQPSVVMMSLEDYQAMEETEIYILNKSSIEELLRIHPKFEILARIATENELITYQRMVASFITKSAEQRYVELLNTQKELFQRVPQQYIASFLGVSPETLSRIKSRVLKKGIS